MVSWLNYRIMAYNHLVCGPYTCSWSDVHCSRLGDLPQGQAHHSVVSNGKDCTSNSAAAMASIHLDTEHELSV